MLIKRQLQKELKNLLLQYPIVIITGARQTGKTTLAKMVSNKTYINLEAPDNRLLAEEDARLFFSKIKENGAIIDEFQRVPELASYLQEIVDANREPGKFILTGSNNFLLMEKVSQSLAGRAAILHLPPFSLQESSTYNNLTSNELLHRGFYPAVVAQQLDPTKYYMNYFRTYIERDVRNLINIKDLSTFQRFMRLCAGRVGQLLNYDQLSNETGVSSNTIKSWITVLEASFLIYLLPPFYKNIKKRLIKSPKLYFNDTGIATYLLGIENINQLENHPLRGSLFENMVVNEYLKYRLNLGLENNSLFYRDNHKNEVDLVFQKGKHQILIEIKSSQTYHTKFREKLDWLANQLIDEAISKMIIYDGDKEYSNEDISVSNFRNFIKLIDNQPS